MQKFLLANFGREWNGEFCEALQCPKLYVVEERLNNIGFFGFMPKTVSYGEIFILDLSCELYAEGKVLTFCDLLSHCASKTMQRNVFNCLPSFYTSTFDNGSCGVRGLYCMFCMRQKYLSSPLKYFFHFHLLKYRVFLI